MADITFTDTQLEAWFNETYTAANSSAENAAAYQNAQDKDTFRREKIAVERKTRLIEYLNALNQEAGRNISGEASLNSLIENAKRYFPDLSEQDIIQRTADNIIKDSNHNEVSRERSSYSDQNAFALDTLRIETLQDMKVISDEDAKDLTPQKAIELLNNTMPRLNDAQLKEMESRFTDKIIDDDSAFRFIPPSMLAKKYNELSATIEATADNNDQQQAHQKAIAQKEKIAGRIDQLTDMLVNNEHGPDDLYFADPTNTADVHEGYTAMFEARAKDLRAQQENSDNENVRKTLAAQLSRMETGQNMLDEKLAEYEQVYNINEITPDNSDDLDKRFDNIQKQLDKTQPNEETLALVSNFKFLDENGKPKPQFIDKDGKESDVYTPGAKIIKGSELETAIQLAKQKTTLLTLGTRDELTPEFLQQQLSDNLTGTLYSLHITNQVNSGISENPNQFTNPQYLEQFKNDLANTQKPMVIHTQVFDLGVDRIVNETAGYATALNNKLKKDKDSPTPSVVLKLFNPIEKIDKRAADRTQSDANKLKFRAEMRKRLLKSGVSAFAVSTGITVLSAGTNKIVGAGVGLSLGLGLTVHQLIKHYKQSKKAGKRFKLDRNLALTLGTTALSGFAIGAMATGNPEMALAAGLGALALGSTNGGIQIAKQAKESGLGKAETAAWIVGQVAVNVGAAFAGRLAGGAIVDAVNTHTDSNIFKHETTTTKTVTESSQEFEQGTHEASLKTLRTMYTDEQHHFHEAELQEKLDQNLKFIDDNRKIFEDRGYQLDELDDPTQKLALAEKMELTKIALGENTGIDTLQHVDGGGIHHSHGNHFTMTDKVLAADGFKDPAQARSDFMNMFNSSDTDAISKGMDSFEKINMNVLGKHNEINYSDAQTMANSHHDGVLHKDAVLGDNGKLHVDWEKGTEYNTYAEGPGTLHFQIHETTVTTTEYVPNEVHPGVGMFGILGDIFGRKLKDRDGALADKIKEVRGKINPKPNQDIPPHHDDPKPIPVREDDPKPTPVIPQQVEKLAVFEYQILKGKDPQTTDDPANATKHKDYLQWVDYCTQVEKERKAVERQENKSIPMDAFLTRRFAKFMENMKPLKQNTARTTEEKEKRVAMLSDFPQHHEHPYNSLFCQELYESIDKSNLSEKEDKKVSRTPFTSFEQITHYVGEFARDTWFVKLGTRDISRMTSDQQATAQERLATDYRPTHRINVGSLDEFYGGEVKTSTEYEHQQLMLDQRDKSWRVIVGEAWNKLTGIAKNVKRKQPSLTQTNDHVQE